MRPAVEAFPAPVPPTGRLAGLTLAALAALLLGLGIFPGPLLEAITRLVAAL